MLNLKVISLNEYKKIKSNFSIYYAFYSSSFGKCLIGIHHQSICHLSFVNLNESKNIEILKNEWPGAKLIYEAKEIEKIAKKVFSEKNYKINVLLKGTSFEEKVWRELIKIPMKNTKTYQEVSEMIGQRKAVRAVANAIAKNFVCYLIPCHRVISKKGNICKYRWGPEVKKKLLEFEKCLLQ